MELVCAVKRGVAKTGVKIVLKSKNNSMLFLAFMIYYYRESWGSLGIKIPRAAFMPKMRYVPR